VVPLFSLLECILKNRNVTGCPAVGYERTSARLVAGLPEAHWTHNIPLFVDFNKSRESPNVWGGKPALVHRNALLTGPTNPHLKTVERSLVPSKMGRPRSPHRPHAVDLTPPPPPDLRAVSVVERERERRRTRCLRPV